MSRKIGLKLWLLALVFLSQAMTSLSSQPNIVFVLIDDYGYNDVGYHNKKIMTPNLDAISAEGVRLENYYVQPICSPTRSQLLSGRYQIHTGLQNGVIRSEQPNALPRDSPTIAEKLKESGYSTHAIGKWHVGFYKKEYLPINRGFDTYYGYYAGRQDYYSHKLEYYPPAANSKSYLDLHDQDQPVWNETGHYSAHLFTSKAIQRIQQHDKSKPFFMYLAYQSVHEPLQVPESYMKPYADIKNIPRRIYCGMVNAMDEGVGNVTKALKDAGMWNNTVFVVSTDNGGPVDEGANNYPLRGSKAKLWEGGVRAVGFVRAPNMKTSGTVSKAFLHVTDWFPTLVGLAGGSLNGTKDLDGFDQWKAISAGLPSARTVLLHNIDPLSKVKGRPLFNDTFDTRIRAGIRYKDWKLLTGDPGLDKSGWYPPPDFNNSSMIEAEESKDPQEKQIWLFNITADPTEHFDLSDKYPTVVRKLLDMLVEFNKTAVPCRYPSWDPNSNPALHGGVWGPWE